MKLSNKQKLQELITVASALKEILFVEFIRQKENSPEGITDLQEEMKNKNKGNYKLLLIIKGKNNSFLKDLKYT